MPSAGAVQDGVSVNFVEAAPPHSFGPKPEELGSVAAEGGTDVLLRGVESVADAELILEVA